MANESIFEKLTQYRLKVEKDGKPVVNVPSILALPGMLMAPKLSVAGLLAAPLLGLKVHLENEDGKEVDVEGTARDAVKTARDAAATAAKTIKEEMDKAWVSVSEDPETEEDTEANAESSDQGETVQDIVDELEKHEEDTTPVIEVKADDSAED